MIHSGPKVHHELAGGWQNNINSIKRSIETRPRTHLVAVEMLSVGEISLQRKAVWLFDMRDFRGIPATMCIALPRKSTKLIR